MKKYETAAINKFGNNFRRNKDTELIFPCIKCGRQKLYVNTISGVYHCFRCDFKGKLKSTPNLKDIKQKFNLEKLNSITNINSTAQQSESTFIYFISKELTDEQKLALKNRGIAEADIKFYNICGRPEDNRIQIPNNIKGKFTDFVCAWQYDKSKITNTNPKYLNTEGTKKDKILFNLHNIEQNPEQIILVEGIFNAISAGKNAVASYGCHLSNTQCDLLLSKQPKSILIAYDSDEPGVKGSLDVISKLKNKNYLGKLEYILLPVGIDINDLGHSNFVTYTNSHKVIIDLNSPMSLTLPKLLYDSKHT